MFIRFFVNLYVKFLNMYKNYMKFKIERVILDYTYSNDTMEDEYLTDFWKRESKYWKLDEISHHTIDITRLYLDEDIPLTPSCVKDVKLTVKYNFNNKIYKYVTKDIYGHKWPPTRPKNELRFSVPIEKVWLIDDYNVCFRDVTYKYNRYAGPYGDFWGEDVNLTPYDIFVANEFSRIKIVNMLGQEREIDYSSTLVAK